VEEFTLFVRHSACGSESFGGAFDWLADSILSQRCLAV
jgi:hypothetical protein